VWRERNLLPTWIAPSSNTLRVPQGELFRLMNILLALVGTFDPLAGGAVLAKRFPSFATFPTSPAPELLSILGRNSDGGEEWISMSVMPTSSAPSVQQLLVYAWKLSQHGLHPSAHSQLVCDSALLELWTCTRALSRYWRNHLPDVPATGQTASVHRWAAVGYQILAADMLFRVYATTACAVQQNDQRASPRPILDHIVQHIAHPRWHLLDLLTADAEGVATVDLFRRRCERWTDLLIGPWMIKDGRAAYAYDPRRAWDYGEDTALSPSSAWADALLAPSFRSAFGGPESLTQLSGEGWQTILWHMSLATGSLKANVHSGQPVAGDFSALDNRIPVASQLLKSQPAPLGVLEESLRKLNSADHVKSAE